MHPRFWVHLSSVSNRPEAPRGTAGIMPRGRDGWHRTRPLAVVRCRAKSSGDGRALHARPFLVYGSETHVILPTYADGRGGGSTAGDCT